MHEVTNYTIIDGPTMHDIMSDMMDGHATTFLTNNARITMQVNVVEREDGSGMGFNLEGEILNTRTQVTKVHVRTRGVGGPVTVVVG